MSRASRLEQRRRNAAFTALQRLEQRRRNAAFTALQRLIRTRYYISFNCKNSYDPATRTYRKYAWPKLFPTADAAWTAIRALPVFINREANEHRGRIVSCSVERVLIR